MKTAELKQQFIDGWCPEPSHLNPLVGIRFVKDLNELLESYAKEHAIEFLAFYEKFAGILDPMSDEYKNGVYTEWINQ